MTWIAWFTVVKMEMANRENVCLYDAVIVFLMMMEAEAVSLERKGCEENEIPVGGRETYLHKSKRKN